MSGDRPACRLTRWLSLIAGIAAVTGVLFGLSSGVRADSAPPPGQEARRALVQFTTVLDCQSQTCTAELLTLGRRQRFEITNIACPTAIKGNGEVHAVELLSNETRGDAPFAVQQFLSRPNTKSAQATTYYAGGPTTFVAGPNEIVRASVTADDTFLAARCTVTGYKVKFRRN
jgi:hypothetical protein